MPEYIEREALLEKVRKLSNTYSYCGLASVHMIKAIEDAPTADVVEAKHGEWIEKSLGLYECSICGHHICGFNANIKKTNYCDDCGAKMDKKEGAEDV